MTVLQSPTPAHPLRVVVAAQQNLVRAMLSDALKREVLLDSTAQVGSAEGLMCMTDPVPDVAVVERDLLGTDCRPTLRKVARRLPTCGVVAFGHHDAEWLVNAIEAGLVGYVPRDASLQQLVSAIMAVGLGQLAVPRRVFRDLILHLIRSQQQHHDAVVCLERLTRQERRVLSLLIRGETNETIAAQLGISPETSRTHLQKILGRLGVHSRLEAVTYVLQNRVLCERLRGTQ